MYLVNINCNCFKPGEIWAVTENAVFRFKVTKEERNVWQIYCENQQFDLAKKYSRGNEAFYNHVLIKEADMLFDNKEYEKSAQRYAETQSSFEEICLKFIKVSKEDALNVFLQKKLDNLKPQDKTQITMIALWVIELYLSKLEDKRLNDMEQTPAYHNLQKEFETFLALSHVANCVKNNKQTVYDLMASHGDKQNLMKFTIVNKDFEQVRKTFYFLHYGSQIFFRFVVFFSHYLHLYIYLPVTDNFLNLIHGIVRVYICHIVEYDSSYHSFSFAQTPNPYKAKI